MPYEKVSDGDSRISIRKTGSIGINQSAMEKLMVSSSGGYVDQVEVAYDEEIDVMAILVVDENTPDSYTVTRTPSGCTISPTAGMEQHGITPDDTYHYEPEKMDKLVVDGEEYERVVCVDLNEPVDTYGAE